MQLKGVLFDFDGVVLDSMSQHVIAWQHAFKQQGIELADLEIYLMEGMGVKSVVKTICEKYNLPDELIPILIKNKTEYYKNHLQVKFYDGFFELIDYLKSQNLEMVVVTGGDRNRIIPFADQYLNGYFKGFVCSNDVMNTKPDPEPYLQGLRILELLPEKCIVIENAPLGIRAAKTAGIQTFAIETTLDKTYLKEADLIFNSFHDLQSKIRELVTH